MNEYWRQREEQAQREYRLTEEEYIEELNSIYDYMLDRINEDIRSFYSRYASREGITYAEATERVSNTVIEEYERKAKKYVEEHDFSAQANEEMRIYNLTMRVNRLETLKAEIGLEMVDGFNELDTVLGEDLTERAVQEMVRQSGILGMTVKDTARTANAIVGASFHNATFSERIWMYQDELKSQLDILLRQGLIQGRGPRELADQILRRFDVSRNEAERLMRTELCRVQTEAQMQSFIANGFDEYQYNALSTACPVCRALDEKHFKIVDMRVGENAPPLHPNCVTAGTKIIAPDAEAIMRSWYSGDIVEIRTANGTRLSVTPNHIVLTARGWVRAKNLVKGDKVIHYRGDVSDGVHAEPADNDCTATVEDLFTAIVEASGGATLRVPVSPVDLKGDVVPDSEIDIVPVNGELRNKLDTATKKLVSDSLLVGAGKLGERELPFNSTLMTFLCGIGLVADGIMSGLRISEILLRGALGHHEMKSLRLGSDYDARLKKTATDGGTANTELLGDGVFADAGIIKSDDFGRVQVVSDASERDVVVMKCSGDGGAVQSESVSDVLRRHTAFIKGDNLSNVLALSGAGQTDAVSVESISNDVATDAINISDVVDCFPAFVEFDNIEFVSIRKNFAGHVYDTSCMSTLYISNGIITSNCFCATSAYMDDATYNEWLDTYQNHGMSYQDWLNNRPTAVEPGTSELDACKTVQDVEDLLKSKNWMLREEFEGDVFDYNSKIKLDGLDLESAKAVYSAYEALFDKYPQLVGQLHGVTTKNFRDWSRSAETGFDGIILNTQFFSDSERFNSDYAEWVEMKKSPSGTTGVMGTIFHELGHEIDYYLTGADEILFSKNTKWTSGSLRPKVMKACGLKVNENTITDSVSIYATKNSQEWFAEAFAEYMESDSPRAVASELGRQLDELLREAQ